MKAAFAEGTTKNLEVQWKAYLLFCEFYGLKALPTTSDILCLYAQFLCRSFKSVESVKNYVSGVKTMHYMLDIEFPPQKLVHLNLLFKGLSRKKKPSATQSTSHDTTDFVGNVFLYGYVQSRGGHILVCLFIYVLFNG